MVAGYQFPDASNPTAVTGTPAPPATVTNNPTIIKIQFHRQSDISILTNKVAPYVAPVGTWGAYEVANSGSCADDTNSCDARFLFLIDAMMIAKHIPFISA